MLESLTDITSLTGLAAIGAAVAAGWSRIKNFGQQILGVVVLQKGLTQSLTVEVYNHLRASYTKAPSGVSKYISLVDKIDDNQHNSLIPFDMPDRASIWWGKRGTFLFNHRDSSLLCLRWLGDPKSLVVDALDASDMRMQDSLKLGSGNFYIKQVTGTVGSTQSYQRGQPIAKPQRSYGAPQDAGSIDSLETSEFGPDRRIDTSFRYEKHRYVRSTQSLDPLKGLFYQDEVHLLLEQLTAWYKQRDWYLDRAIPWKTGVLLHGPGGTGKSRLAKVIAQKLGLPLYQYCLNTFTDLDFVEEWQENMSTPCVVALEDFDTVFHGRTPTTVHQSLSFECVLNQISGINSPNGILLIVTTNHLDLIDEALGRMGENGLPTRPGRIDRILHMGLTTENQRREMARYTLDWMPLEKIETFVKEGEGMTAAQFQNECIKHAQEYLALRDATKY
jgi:hypothetical protein